MLGCPEVMVGDGVVVDLKDCLVVFGDKNGFIVADDFANPDVVVIVGVFDGLDCLPFFGG